MTDLKLNEVDVHKLNLQKGEVLVVKVRSADVLNEEIERLGEGLRMIFPNNKVLVMSVGPEGDIDFSVIKEEKTRCGDCMCSSGEGCEG